MIFRKTIKDMKLKKIIFVFLAITSLTTLIAAIYFFQAFVSYEMDFLEKEKSRAVTLTRSAAGEINTILKRVMVKAETVAEGLATGKINKENLHDVLEEVAGSEKYIYGISVAYEPYAFDGKKRLYAPYYVKKNGGEPELVRIESIYNYTEEGHSWYNSAMERGSVWLEPFYGRAGEVLETVYSVPFYQNSKALGVVSISLPIDYLKKIITDLDLGPNGFGALLSGKGVYLYHPDPEYARSSKTIFEVAESRDDQDRIIAGRLALQGKSGVLEHMSTTTGLDSWLVFEPIPTTGWSLQNTFIKNDIYFDVSIPRHLLIWLSVSIIFFLISTSALLIVGRGWSAEKIWFISTLSALLFTAGIGFTWYLTLAYSSNQEKGGQAISDKETLHNVIRSYRERCIQDHMEAPSFVPTGIFVQSLNYSESKDLSVVGYVWQKYETGMTEGFDPKLSIPGAEELEISTPQRFSKGKEEIIRWSFKAKIKQNEQPSDYPLEQEIIGIRLQSENVERNIILVPDLSSYKVMSPSALPGLAKDIVVRGWDIRRSYFELVKNNGNTFPGGISPAGGDFPSLRFSISVRRNFVDSFISTLTPLIVVAILLFVILMLTTDDRVLMKKFDAGTSKVIAMCSALFFVIIFAHIDIRKSISPNNVFYLEYFYLVMYLALLWVSANSILFPISGDAALIRYRNNLPAKIAYWPGVMFLLYLLTVIQFY